MTQVWTRVWTRIGVYIDDTCVTVAVVRRGATLWSGTAPLQTGDESIAPEHVALALGSLLIRAPHPRWLAARVTVVLGAPWARVKLVKGLPLLKGHRQLVTMLRMNASRFVATAKPVIITGADTGSPGEAYIGIADRMIVDTITHKISSRGFRIARMIPAIALESAISSGDSVDNAGQAGTVSAHESVASRAATMHGPTPMALRPQDNPAAAIPDAPRKRVAMAAAILAAAILVFVGTQLKLERVSLARHQAALRDIASLADSGATESRELGSIDRDLATAARFSRRRVSAALLLGAITQALPAEAAITTLRIDTTSVDIVVLSPRTAAVLDALGDIPDVASPTIIGPVSRETVGPRELERATIRLRITPDDDLGKVAFEVERERDRERDR